MKPGSQFETFVKFVQDSLKDDLHTVVEKNVKLTDLYGGEREFDILIRTVAHRSKIVIAIECKDYASKIPIGRLDEFIEKCNSVPEINKRIFVSKKGFQSGAIDKARRLNVELYTLRDIDPSTVEEWVSEFGLFMNDFDLKVEQVVVVFCKPHPPGLNGNVMLKRSTLENQEASLQEILQEEVNRWYLKWKEDTWAYYEQNSAHLSGVESFKREIKLDFRRAMWYWELEHDNLFLVAVHLLVDFRPVVRKLEPENAKSYNILEGEEPIGRMLSYDVTNSGTIRFTVIPIENDHGLSQLFITDAHGSNIFGEGTILLPKDVRIDFMRQLSELESTGDE